MLAVPDSVTIIVYIALGITAISTRLWVKVGTYCCCLMVLCWKVVLCLWIMFFSPLITCDPPICHFMIAIHWRSYQLSSLVPFRAAWVRGYQLSSCHELHNTSYNQMCFFHFRMVSTLGVLNFDPPTHLLSHYSCTASPSACLDDG